MASVPCQSASNPFDTPYLHSETTYSVDTYSAPTMCQARCFGVQIYMKQHLSPSVESYTLDWIYKILHIISRGIPDPCEFWDLLRQCTWSGTWWCRLCPWHKGSRMTLNSFAFNLTCELVVDERPMLSIMVLFVAVWFRGGQCFS